MLIHVKDLVGHPEFAITPIKHFTAQTKLCILTPHYLHCWNISQLALLKHFLLIWYHVAAHLLSDFMLIQECLLHHLTFLMACRMGTMYVISSPHWFWALELQSRISMLWHCILIG